MWRPVRHLSLALITIVVLGLTATCSAASAPSSKTVLSLGDSLAVGTDEYLGGLLPDWAILTSAVVGRRSDQGLVALKRRKGELPRVLLLSLGTNDDPNDVDEFAETIEEVERLAGPRRCIIWATIVRPPVNGTTYDAFNAVLRAEDSRLRSFRVLDWATIVKRSPRYLRNDGVHAVAEGYKARATEAARVIHRC